jgi:hypothetical protein
VDININHITDTRHIFPVTPGTSVIKSCKIISETMMHLLRMMHGAVNVRPFILFVVYLTMLSITWNTNGINFTSIDYAEKRIPCKQG